MSKLYRKEEYKRTGSVTFGTLHSPTSIRYVRAEDAEQNARLGAKVREALDMYSGARALQHKLLRQHAGHVRFLMAQAVLYAVVEALEEEA